MRKVVTKEFETEEEALAFMSKDGGTLRCKECGYTYPRHCEKEDCQDVKG